MRAEVTLADKYELESGRAFMTGVQALVRLPMLIRQIDKARGLNTAGFISGYRGSPLGTYDMQLAQAEKLLKAHDIVVQRGINEDLGATAVWGTQHVPLFDGHKKDGVFGLWYGKGPGVDRTGDVLKHANFAGTSALGGVLALAGDDHSCKSSTLPNQSEFAFADAEMPVVAPSTIDEVIEFGAKGIQLSRYSGCWIGMKTIADLMDASTSATLDMSRYYTRIPDYELPDGGLNIRLNDPAEAKEVRHRHFRLPAAQAFVRANGFDRVVRDAARPRFGIATSGKGFLHVLDALRLLKISDAEAADIGLRLWKVGLVWPLDPVAARDFADGLETVLVIEERRDLIVRAPVVRPRFPQSRAVEVHVPAAFARGFGHRDELVPGRQEPAELALRQLDQQRRDGFGECAYVVERDWRDRRCERHEVEPVQARDPVAFVQREVVGGVRGKRPQAGAVGDDAQRDLLRHGSARHEDAGFFTQQIRDALFEGVEPDAGSVEVDVGARFTEETGRGENRGGVGTSVTADRVGAVEAVGHARHFAGRLGFPPKLADNAFAVHQLADQVDALRRLRFSHQALDVIGNRRVRDVERFRDLAVAHALEDEVEDLHLAFRQPVRLGRADQRATAAEALDQHAHARRPGTIERHDAQQRVFVDDVNDLLGAFVTAFDGLAQRRAGRGNETLGAGIRRPPEHP